MLTITGINTINKEPYKETISRGNSEVSITAPILGFYSVVVESDVGVNTFEAEVRYSPNGQQIDWQDELQDQLMLHRCSEIDFGNLSEAIYSVHNKIKITLPFTLGINNVP